MGIARLHDMARSCCLHASHFGLSGARGDDPEDVGICEPCAIALAKIRSSGYQSPLGVETRKIFVLSWASRMSEMIIISKKQMSLRRSVLA